MSIFSKYITRNPQKIGEMRDMGINLNDFEGPIDTSTFGGLIKKAITRVQPTGIINQDFIGRDFSMFDKARMGQPIRDYSDSELMESDTTTRDGILSTVTDSINPLNILGFLANVYTGGGTKQALTTSGVGKLFSNILEAGRDTPNYQFTNPNKPGFNRIASDFYDPRTGLDRFDRAKTLFGQSRTMKEFLDKLKDRRAAEAAELAAKQQAARTAIADAGSGFDDYGPGQGAGMGFGGGRSDPTDKS
tara:strand:+ start:137 stop:877 length:741 start_codon:yes stop_codon:yes gene_type:complete